jgi:ABC-type ATPase involved in cell division
MLEGVNSLSSILFFIHEVYKYLIVYILCIMEKLSKSTIPLTSVVEKDDFIIASEKAFDCIFDGTSKFYPWVVPSNIPQNFKIGIIVGSSGSGKSTLLNNFGIEDSPEWDNSKSIISHFESPDEAINKLGAVGLNTIPSWYKSYGVLSNGEKFRADLARKLKSNSVIDEFTSVVDRNVAKAASISLSRYVKNNDIDNIVLATCHRDILEWLEPDWVIDTDTGEFHQGFFLSVQKSKLMYIEQTIISGQCLKTIII